MKKLIPALCLLLISAILMGTSTYAWFSMNTQVTATGMQVKAIAEDGLLIKNELDDDAVANWKVSTTASFSTLAALAPTSTANVVDWYHNKSDNQNSAKADQLSSTYEKLSADTKWKRDSGANKSGTYYIDSDSDNTKDTEEKAYVLLNKFYIKSSGDAITLGADKTYKDLYVNKVNVSATSASAALDASLRVAIKVGSTLYIYAPVASATTTYHPGGNTGTETAPAWANTVTADVPATQGIVNSTLLVNGGSSTATIPAVTETTLANWVCAEVYIYFEGEDAGLKSANLVTTLDTLNVEVIFGITTVSAS